MKKKINVIQIIICLASIQALTLCGYITGYAGVALDEAMTFEEYFNKIVNLELLLFFVLLANVGLNIYGIYLRYSSKNSR